MGGLTSISAIHLKRGVPPLSVHKTLNKIYLHLVVCYTI